ncbi:hypothetical protein GRI75_10595 [Altererythrobacter soli]|uniref:Uncharacterized protein n=1 Tax=Croceibacterium soli TaxID=1739690 RepID=A0A6I4UTV8_9SPHN|nr:hypothetical protein [Croceibacterium soli]MXP42088.1 hypothetical protein [Croceibacterium soli]
MYYTTERPFTGEPLLGPTTHRARVRAETFLTATGVMLDTSAPRDNAMLTECYVAPYGGFVLAATCCDRPLLYPEGELIGDATGHDVTILRFHPLRGTSFDILPYGSERWLCRYLAWRRRSGNLWLIPSAVKAPYVRVCGWGLELVDTAPFDSEGERNAGIILAIDNPSFEGRI